jgi:hypothetical protein
MEAKKRGKQGEVTVYSGEKEREKKKDVLHVLPGLIVNISFLIYFNGVCR